MCCNIKYFYLGIPMELYLSLSIITWTPCIDSILNIGGCSSLPEAEARGTLGTLPSELHAILYLPLTRSLPKHLWVL